MKISKLNLSHDHVNDISIDSSERKFYGHHVDDLLEHVNIRGKPPIGRFGTRNEE